MEGTFAIKSRRTRPHYHDCLKHFTFGPASRRAHDPTSILEDTGSLRHKERIEKEINQDRTISGSCFPPKDPRNRR